MIRLLVFRTCGSLERTKTNLKRATGTLSFEKLFNLMKTKVLIRFESYENSHKISWIHKLLISVLGQSLSGIR